MSYPWDGAQRPFAATPPAAWSPSVNWGIPARPGTAPNPFAGPPGPPELAARGGGPRVGAVIALGLAYVFVLALALAVSAALTHS